MTYKFNDPCPRQGCTGRLHEASLYDDLEGRLTCTHCRRQVASR